MYPSGTLPASMPFTALAEGLPSATNRPGQGKAQRRAGVTPSKSCRLPPRDLKDDSSDDPLHNTCFWLHFWSHRSICSFDVKAQGKAWIFSKANLSHRLLPPRGPWVLSMERHFCFILPSRVCFLCFSPYRQPSPSWAPKISLRKIYPHLPQHRLQHVSREEL